jgi:hypothetical protein
MKLSGEPNTSQSAENALPYFEIERGQLKEIRVQVQLDGGMET